MKKFRQTLLLMTLVFVVPLLPNLKLLGTWPVMMAMLAAFTLNMTQPSYALHSLNQATSHDRHSILLLLISGLLVFLLPLLDYSYGRQLQLCWCSWPALLGIACVVGGLGFRAWSISVLGQYFTARVEIVDGHQIVQSGPYRYLRHPSYTGSLLMAFGISIILASWLGLVFCGLVFFPVYLYRIACEEKTLVDTFGEQYRSYRQTTWKLVPFII